ncbi:MAG TPA: hypothetical protein VMV20_03235 [Chitinophagaceae bacterium]|nr:hypothetical protein [Chitinophagaceae bacterium]
MKSSFREAASPILITLVLISFKAPAPSFVEHWGWMTNAETRGYIDFNQNGIFMVPPSEGGDSVAWENFNQMDDTLKVSDADVGNEEGYWASYQLTFYGPDSLPCW